MEIDTIYTKWQPDEPADKPCWRHENGKIVAILEEPERDEPWIVAGENSRWFFETEEEAKEYVQEIIHRDHAPSPMF
mgnify:FL=1